MSTDLGGRSAIVTGAGGGIGRATAIELAKLGAAVVVNDIGTAVDGSPLAAAVVEEIRAAGGNAEASVDSVTDFDAAANIVETAVRSSGGADILVNNAGIAWSGVPWELDAETFERVTATHIKGSFNCMRHAVPHMRKKGWGRIVNLVSRAGIIGLPGTLAYGVGKGGVFGLTNAASRDLAGEGITVNAVNPTSTYTPMVAAALSHLEESDEEGRQRARNLRSGMQTPEQVAVLIATLCTPAAGGINGQVFLVERNRVGLFQPLTVTQEVQREADWNVGDLCEALGKLRPHELFDAYG